MKILISWFRTLRTSLALAALSCSVVAFAQPGVPPIEMPISQFNEGRPANFYYLADATEGYESLCEEVLEALNEPYSEVYSEYGERDSKFLLRSHLSVPWTEKPRILPNGDRYRLDIRHSIIDLNNDGELEDVIVSVSLRSSAIVHSLAISRKGVLPTEFSTLSRELAEALIADGAYNYGRKITESFGSLLSLTYDDYYNTRTGSGLTINIPFLDIVDVNSTRFILLTGASAIRPRLDVFALRLKGEISLESSCRLTSRFSVVR